MPRWHEVRGEADRTVDVYGSESVCVPRYVFLHLRQEAEQTQLSQQMGGRVCAAHGATAADLSESGGRGGGEHGAANQFARADGRDGGKS